MTYKDAAAWLETHGWKWRRALCDEDDVWVRRYPDVKPGCRANRKQDGLVMLVSGYRFPDGTDLFCVHVTVKSDHGEWLKLECHTLRPGQLVERLDAIVEKLIRAWKAANEEECMMKRPATELSEEMRRRIEYAQRMFDRASGNLDLMRGVVNE